ncbi:hypothetical protein HN51_022883 [Arachis hypogaea]|uniref:gamma-interferon-responsive lysosomal thiol protein n=1 Tax=Arachis hypogaea TaxID=3818 RepID=UPI000DEC0B60|nr:gamma-interferon-responsive lysosomal thiol protein [Arachis hypogaea]QHO54236.1 Gamma-interferon-inducible lysosomal thiol reductase [Arachis hypogaea]
MVSVSVSPKPAITIVMALVLFFIFIYESKGSDEISPLFVADKNNNKVNLSVYYESLCQPCATFIIKNLYEIFNTNLISIVNLQLVPYANSHVNLTNNSISCQNGQDECILNSLESCAMNLWSDVGKYYGLIYCFEFLAIEGRSNKWQDCFDQLGLPLASILNCSRGNGTELAKKYIEETTKLHPPHSFLPWVVINNQPIAQDYANFTYFVCKAYKGIAVPDACNPIR